MCACEDASALTLRRPSVTTSDRRAKGIDERQFIQAQVVVDLTDVSYIVASGIATLVEALKIARNRQNNLL